MKTLLKLAIIHLCLHFVLAVSAFAAHTVTLTWTDTLNPIGTTYNVSRATGLCSGTPAFSGIAAALTTMTYVDSTVTVGNYCYVVTATSNGATSANSNSAPAVILPYPPVLGSPTVTMVIGQPMSIRVGE